MAMLTRDNTELADPPDRSHHTGGRQRRLWSTAARDTLLSEFLGHGVRFESALTVSKDI